MAENQTADLQKRFDAYKEAMRNALNDEEEKVHRIRQAWLKFREEMDTVFPWSME